MAKSIKILGWLIVGVALVYFVQRFIDVLPDIELSNFKSFFFFALAFGIIVYSFAQYLLAFGWANLLSGACGSPVEFGSASEVYARSNIAKYLPGNVFHLVGRQVLGRQFGWSQAALALASFLETAVVTFTVTVILLAYGAFWNSQIYGLIPTYILYLALAGLLIVPWALPRIVERLPFAVRYVDALDVRQSVTVRRLAVSFLVFLIFFAITGVAMWVLLQGFNSGEWKFETLGIITAAYVAAWILGMITPGASGGIGVREAALVFLLGDTIGEADAVTLAIAIRLVTTGGDGLFFISSLLCRRPKKSLPSTDRD